MQHFHLLLARMCRIIPFFVGVQSINNESKINPLLTDLNIICKVKFGIIRVLFTLRHGLNRDFLASAGRNALN